MFRLEHDNREQNRGMTEKRKQRHRPHAGDDRPGKPSRIAFWDNIFYWLWHYTARSGGYAFRAGGIIALIQFIYCLLAIAIAINCLDAEAAWTLYLHEKGKGIAGGLVILLLPALMIGKAQNGLPGVPRRDSRGRVCRVPAVLPLRRAVPDAGIGRREENGKGMRIWTGASFVWARWILRPDRSYYWFFVIFLKMYTLSVEKSYYLCRSKSGNIKT